ncbi:MAG: hypothetical protein AMS18_00270 [Gemmatimonas sp. SG8_17]|nr:MAG: hypothetical protein AMS18_00270 [Gemmatimonas sp. SG8_17]
MPWYTVVNYGCWKDHFASVHKRGCRSIKNDARKNWGSTWDEEADNPEEIVKRFVDDINMDIQAEGSEGWGYDMVRVHSCCKEA